MVKRKCESWVEAFVDHTENLESSPTFRRWAAIGTLAAVLEQKVWLQTSSPLYPNLYIFLVGHPGVGKTRTIRVASAFLREIPDFYLSPTSMSAAALVDALVHAKRSLIRLPDPPMEYNSMMICADELSAFMHKFDDEMIGNLTTFYDVDVYGHKRRGKEIDIKIKHPQLSILSGTTPSNLLNFMPENAWDQGFTSRVIMVFSDERIISDDIFAFKQRGLPDPMLHDLRQINTLAGPFGVTDEYKSAINNWRKLGQPPVPTHPKLAHYCTRRLAHLFKLSMVSAVDRSNALILSRDDFNRAMTWMVEAESTMPEIFKAGSTGADSKAMDELFHFCLARAEPVSEPLLVREARKLVPAMSVMRVIEVMMLSGMIKVAGTNKGIRHFKAVPMNSDA